MSYDNREHFLDELYDHLRGEEEWGEEDNNWFETKVASFFRDDGVGPQKVGRRRAGQQPASPKRRPGNSSGGESKKEGKYGLGLFYGGQAS